MNGARPLARTLEAGGGELEPSRSGAAGRGWRAPGWQAHALVATLCSAAIAAGWVLQLSSGSGALSILGVTIPELCAWRGVTGLPCPGCGLTRAWVAVLHGDFAASVSHHLLGWLVLLYAAAQATRHAAWLAFPAKRAGVERIGRGLDRGLIALGVALLVVWVPVLLHALLAAH
jgi:hypothetical protein